MFRIHRKLQGISLMLTSLLLATLIFADTSDSSNYQHQTANQPANHQLNQSDNASDSSARADIALVQPIANPITAIAGPNQELEPPAFHNDIFSILPGALIGCLGLALALHQRRLSQRIRQQLEALKKEKDCPEEETDEDSHRQSESKLQSAA